VSKDNDLRVRRYTGFTTDEKQGEAALQLEAIFRASQDLLLYMDLDGRIIDYKTGTSAPMFLPPGEFLGKRLTDILPAEIDEKISRAFQQSLQGNKVVSLEITLALPNGEHTYDIRLVALEGTRIIAILRDETERVQANERSQRQARQLSALQSIDATITASFDLSVTLSVILRQVINQLGVDAADVLLLNQNTHMLEFAAGLGFRSSRLEHTALMVGQGYAGQAALKRTMIGVPDLNHQQADLLHLPSFIQEEFTFYYAVPLIAKGQVTGVLEVYRRQTLKPGEDWLEFLTTLAGQAAIAIDSAALFQDLQKTNAELVLAYDAAIEGWSHVLELTGRETKDHIARVVRSTLDLARILGINDRELVHIRRGAFLHDIGEVGISEDILQKPGPLTEVERITVQQHPLIAYQLLAPVSYLATALDIPHYHHERWDGSGYPEGLQREHIPTAARIFAVADVYDAFTSPRPYRPARSHREALEYIRTQSHKHFDPEVVNAFLQSAGALEAAER
jgi:HD-GYP domain-containing protein (c-di-GMP phosphodiesterase class II)